MKLHIKKVRLDDNFHKWLILFLYVFLSISLFPLYRYIVYPDGVAFMAVGQKYREGSFYYALNQSWGPLYSWLLSFYSIFFKDFIISGKVFNLFLGLAVIFTSIKLSAKIGISQKYSHLIGYLALPGVIFFALANGVIADLLFTLIFLFYLLVVLNFNEKGSYVYGLLGGFLYLTKQYGFFLFFFHFCLVFVYYLRLQNQKRKRLISLFIRNILVFFVICFSWSFLLSLKYHQVTFGAQQKYNFALVAPGSQGHPLLHNGLYPLGKGNLFSVWEDFGTIKLKPWNPFSSLSDFKLLIKNIVNNSKELVFQYQNFSIFSASIFLFSFFAIASSKGKKNHKPAILFLSLIIYPLGYLPIMVNDRYLWPSYFLLLIFSVYLSEKLFHLSLNGTKSLFSQAILILIFSFSFIKYPVKHLLARVYQDRNIYELSQKLEHQINFKDKAVASNIDFNNSLILSYYVGAKYYGVFKDGESIDEQKEELKRYKVSYLLLWDNTGKNQNYGQEIYENKKYSLKIVKVQP